jgi:putative membrane protein
MARILIRWGINAIAIWAAIKLVPGIEHTGSAGSLIVIALIFGLVNALVRPILTVLTCPLIILTMGLFILIINALMLGLTAWLVPSLTIDGFWPAFWGALIISLVSGAISLLVREDWEGRRPSRAR